MVIRHLSTAEYAATLVNCRNHTLTRLKFQCFQYESPDRYWIFGYRFNVCVNQL